MRGNIIYIHKPNVVFHLKVNVGTSKINIWINLGWEMRKMFLNIRARRSCDNSPTGTVEETNITAFMIELE